MGSEERVTKESWRAAVTRWGDPVYGLALLLTNERRAAEATTIGAFRRVYSATVPAEPELTLYTVLAQAHHPRRIPDLRRPLRKGVLPRALIQILPIDRLLLGLWLLRNINGAQLASIFSYSPAQVVERLAGLLRRSLPDNGADVEAHLTLEQWLWHRLGLTTDHADHLRICPQCQIAQQHWHAAIDQFRTSLHAATYNQRLSLDGVAVLEDALLAVEGQSEADAEQPWWLQRRVWLPALLACVGLITLGLVVPWGGGSTAGSAAPPTTRAIVQAALDAWGQPLDSATLHQRVVASANMLRAGDLQTTDVWLAGAGSSAHRVEVRRGNTLIEWQLADNGARFEYGALPEATSCQWNTGYPPNLNRFVSNALTFTVPPAEQQAARDARLRQGAYGVGYVALQRALAAPDLRSFGVRTENGAAMAVLSYTDTRLIPRQQVLLRIDLQSHQLRTVQLVSDAGGQTQVRDIWRLEVNETTGATISTTPPPWAEAIQRDRLIDPACPALDPDVVISLRRVAALPWNWYLPSTLPSGTTNAALLASGNALYNNDALLMGSSADINAVYVGPDRWISVSGVDYLQLRRTPTADTIQRGLWTLTIDDVDGSGVLRARLERDPERNYAWTPALEIWAWGLTRDELLAVVDSLSEVNIATWRTLDSQFLDARPLSASASNTLLQSLAALEPQPNQAIHTTSAATVRDWPQFMGDAARVQGQTGAIADPYAIPASMRYPTFVRREQWLVASAIPGSTTAWRDTRTLADNTLFALQTYDGQRFNVYDLPSGSAYTSVAAPSGYTMRQPGSDLLLNMLLNTASITATQQNGQLQLEQERSEAGSPYDDTSFGISSSREPWQSDLPAGIRLQRLWLDQQTFLPQRFEILHRATDGRETTLRTVTITGREVVAPPPAAELVKLPPLPADILRFEVNNNGSSRPVEPLYTPGWRSQTYNWPGSAEINAYNERSPTTFTSNNPYDDLRLGHWDTFQPSALWRQTQYYLSDDQQNVVTLTQGPRRLMRNVLRYSASDPESLWTTSRRIPVVIGGVARDAWLLQDTYNSALVVEVDDVLLHFSGDIGDWQLIIARLPELVRLDQIDGPKDRIVLP